MRSNHQCYVYFIGCFPAKNQGELANMGPDLQKNLRKNPKFSVSFSYVYLKL